MDRKAKPNHRVTNLKKEDFVKICRFCLKDKPAANISNLKYENNTFVEIFFKIFGTYINVSDKLPGNLCTKCIATVIHCYNFKKLVDTSLATLINVSEQSTKVDDDIINVEEWDEHSYAKKIQEIPHIKEEAITEDSIKQEICEVAKHIETNNIEEYISQDNNSVVSAPNNVEHNIQNLEATCVKKPRFKYILPYYCKSCKQWYADRASHQHIKKKPFACNLCEKTFLKFAALRVHRRVHSLLASENEKETNDENSEKTEPQKSYYCACGEIFHRLSEFQIHKRENKHENATKRICQICNKLISHRRYHLHMNSTHLGVRYPCEMCTQTFTLKTNLKRHIRIHTGERPYVCDFCGKGFVQKTSLDDHRKVHTGEKPFLCQHCGERYRTQGSYKTHLNIKHAEGSDQVTEFKRHVCEFCGKSYKHKQSLEDHLKSHTIGGEARPVKEEKYCNECDKYYSTDDKAHKLRCERKYLCSYCGKRFSTITYLKTHITIHTGEKKYTCNYCNKKFTQLIQLQTHQRTHTNQRPYACKYCPKRFRQRSHNIAHMSIHNGERPLKCPYCPKSFAYYTSRVTHIRSHTGEKPYVCDVCSKAFNHSSTMKKHRRGHFDKDIVPKAVEGILGY